MLRKFSFLLCIFSLLAGCGGSEMVYDESDSEDSDSSDDSSSETSSTVSFYPLAFYEAGTDYGVETDAFRLHSSEPFISNYVITPVDAESLSAVDTAAVSDFSMTVDGLAVDSDESFPVLQKILGIDIQLTTAIVIDTSASMDAVDQAALITGVKDFIAAARASSNNVIATQNFTLWAFAAEDEYAGCTGTTSAENIVNLHSITDDDDALASALDTLQSNWAAHAYGRTSALYDAVIKAVGSFIGAGTYEACSSMEYAFNADGDNDLVDRTTLDQIRLSDVVVISAGSRTVGDFDAEAVSTALNWQSLSVFDTSSDDYSLTESGKPLFYVTMGDADDGLSDLADTVISVGSATSSGAYSFASSLVAAQVAAVSERVHDGEQYVYRYAFLPRNGVHETVLSATTDYYSMSLTGEVDLSDGSAAGVGTPEEELSSLVEITGAANEYLANGQISLADLTQLYPATRWTTSTYSASDYSWTVGGSTRSADSSGAITLTSADVGKTVILTNTARGETASILVAE
ncbi:hypothetical protein ACQUQU_14395 [Thalassolituus sp. LLYu03]|uniref:hypothetical protein n=1 Tax=Thalassolituus sp. LLYu03 TaxID=3421656 RepID=UPI003D2D1848